MSHAAIPSAALAQAFLVAKSHFAEDLKGDHRLFVCVDDVMVEAQRLVAEQPGSAVQGEDDLYRDDWISPAELEKRLDVLAEEYEWGGDENVTITERERMLLIDFAHGIMADDVFVAMMKAHHDPSARGRPTTPPPAPAAGQIDAMAEKLRKAYEPDDYEDAFKGQLEARRVDEMKVGETIMVSAWIAYPGSRTSDLRIGGQDGPTVQVPNSLIAAAPSGVRVDDAVQEACTDILHKLDSWAEAYPESAFGPVTEAEREEHGSLISRASASMGRHMSRIIKGDIAKLRVALSANEVSRG